MAYASDMVPGAVFKLRPKEVYLRKRENPAHTLAWVNGQLGTGGLEYVCETVRVEEGAVMMLLEEIRGTVPIDGFWNGASWKFLIGEQVLCCDFYLDVETGRPQGGILNYFEVVIPASTTP